MDAASEEQHGREIDGVARRCKECGQATSLIVSQRDLADDGGRRLAVWEERVPHSKADCKRMAALERETWPMLW